MAFALHIIVLQLNYALLFRMFKNREEIKKVLLMAITSTKPLDS